MSNCLDKPRTVQSLEVKLIKECLCNAEDRDYSVRARLGFPYWLADNITTIADKLYKERMVKINRIQGCGISELPVFLVDKSKYVREAAKERLDGLVSDNISDEDILTAMQENELVVKMLPIKEYKIKVKVKSITKAAPSIVEPGSLV